MTAYRDFGRKQKREVSLEYLISETPLEPFTTDTYFEQYDQPTVFAVRGQEIVVCLLYTSPIPRDPKTSLIPSSA